MPRPQGLQGRRAALHLLRSPLQRRPLRPQRLRLRGERERRLLAEAGRQRVRPPEGQEGAPAGEAGAADEPGVFRGQGPGTVPAGTGALLERVQHGGGRAGRVVRQGGSVGTEGRFGEEIVGFPRGQVEAADGDVQDELGGGRGDR